MGTLFSGLAEYTARTAQDPRIYADANIPIGIVTFMRARLRWDVLFVLEHDDLRRALADVQRFIHVERIHAHSGFLPYQTPARAP